MTTRNAPRPARYATLALLALLAALCHAHEARAQWTTTGTNTTTTNNVGVGTAAPEAGLHVSSSSTVPGNRGIIDEQTSNDGTAATFLFKKSRAGAAVQSGDNIGHMSGAGFDGTSFVTATRLRFLVDGAVSAGNVPMGMQFLTGTNGSGLERMRITSGGNVGIGTAAPLSLFHLHGSSPVLRMSGTASDQHILMTFNDNNNATKGFVGYTGANGTGSRYTGIINTDGDYLGLGTTNPTPVYFFLGGMPAHIMAANGNVGIGTTAPAAKLHVAGDIRIDGNINAKWQDVAEWVPASGKLAAGTVVVLDEARDNHVTASAKSYDTRVAGVVSAKPGISLGEAGEGKALIATTGRVLVKVDAARGAIRVGDLLVTSDVPGVAMLSQPLDLGGVAIHRPGTIIGKALEPLASGTREILVLLSLQ
jgi:hypothetical protein